MKFTTKSVLMGKNGVPVTAEILIPRGISEYDISQKIWAKSIKEFNARLDERDSATQKVNDSRVDILEIVTVMNDHAKVGGIYLLLIIDKEDIVKFENIDFVLKGDLVLTDGIEKSVEDLVIKNITYVGADGKRHHILREKKDESV